MMVNPYESTATNSSRAPRAVRRYIVAFLLLLVVGFGIAFPGLQLLNQEWGLIPTKLVRCLALRRQVGNEPATQQDALSRQRVVAIALDRD